MAAAAAAAVLATVLGLGPPLPWNGPAALPVLPPAEGQTAGHLPFGPVRPALVLPDISVTMNGGGQRPLHDVLAGHWTLVQLVFTGCSTTCPVQGAIFEETQKRLAAAGGDVRLLSISIDPLGDTPELLGLWLRQFGGGANWQAAVPRLEDLGDLLDVLGGRGDGVDVHDARVYLISPKGELAYITEEMPSPKSLINLIKDALKVTAGN